MTGCGSGASVAIDLLVARELGGGGRPSSPAPGSAGERRIVDRHGVDARQDRAELRRS